MRPITSFTLHAVLAAALAALAATSAAAGDPAVKPGTVVKIGSSDSRAIAMLPCITGHRGFRGAYEPSIVSATKLPFSICSAASRSDLPKAKFNSQSGA